MTHEERSIMELKVYGGVGEIGGNKILVSSDGGSIFLDFGKNFAREGEYYEQPFLSPKSGNHLLELGILPALKEIYRWDDAGPGIDGVVLSHAHTDHYDHLRYLRDDIPIFAAPITRDLILSRENCSPGARYISRLTKDGEECSRLFQDTGNEHRDLGGMEIWQHPVDHSVPGAMGTFVDDGETRLVYSGDIRFHGPRAGESRDFVREASSMEPDVLIVEGTNMQEAHMDGEEDVLERSTEIVERTRGLVLVGYPMADLDRMATLEEVGRRTDRKLVISVKQANALNSLRSDGISPPVNMDDLLVFTREKGSRLVYERAVVDEWGKRVLDAEGVNDMQDELILTFNLFDMNESLKISPMPGSTYILSSSEPFSEEMWISHDRLKKWLGHLGIPLYQVHASGHANPHDISEMIESIAPRTVVPVHTECPELFQRFLGDMDVDIQLPIEGRGIIV